MFYKIVIPYGAQGSQMRVLDPLELELQSLVNLHVSAGNTSLDLWRSSQCSLTLSHLSSSLTSYLALLNLALIIGLHFSKPGSRIEGLIIYVL